MKDSQQPTTKNNHIRTRPRKFYSAKGFNIKLDIPAMSKSTQLDYLFPSMSKSEKQR